VIAGSGDGIGRCTRSNVRERQIPRGSNRCRDGSGSTSRAGRNSVAGAAKRQQPDGGSDSRRRSDRNPRRTRVVSRVVLRGRGRGRVPVPIMKIPATRVARSALSAMFDSDGEISAKATRRGARGPYVGDEREKSRTCTLGRASRGGVGGSRAPRVRKLFLSASPQERACLYQSPVIAAKSCSTQRGSTEVGETECTMSQSPAEREAGKVLARMNMESNLSMIHG